MIAANDIKSTYGNEMAAIILCCRVFFETATIDEVDTFISNNPINWKTFRDLSQTHRVRPTVYRVLCMAKISSELKSFVYIETQELIQFQWKYALETNRLINLLKSNNIDAIPYKGVAYSKQFFGDLVSRESTDIDLIIKSVDLQEVKAILERDGYIAELEDIREYLGEDYFSFFKDYNLNKFKDGNREFHVELHWAIAERLIAITPRINSFIYSWTTSITLTNTSLKSLDSLSHFSAILIHHSIKEPFWQLKSIVDIGQALRSQDIKDCKEYIYRYFTDFRLKKSLLVSDLLSRQLLGISLFTDETSKNVVKTAEYFLKQICSLQSLPSTKDYVASLKNTAVLHESIPQKLNFYWTCITYRFIPGPLDFRVIKLPKALFFMYYFLKPFRTLIKPANPLEEKRKLLPPKSS